jgi:hypothetical protein
MACKPVTLGLLIKEFASIILPARSERALQTGNLDLPQCTLAWVPGVNWPSCVITLGAV